MYACFRPEFLCYTFSHVYSISSKTRKSPHNIFMTKCTCMVPYSHFLINDFISNSPRMENFQCHRLLYILALKINKLLLLLLLQPAGGCLLAMGSMIYKEISRCNNTL